MGPCFSLISVLPFVLLTHTHLPPPSPPPSFFAGHYEAKFANTLICGSCGSIDESQRPPARQLDSVGPAVLPTTLNYPRTFLSSGAVQHHLNSGQVTGIAAAATTCAALKSATTGMSPPVGTVRPLLQYCTNEHLVFSVLAAAGSPFPCLACGTSPHLLAIDGSNKFSRLNTRGGQEGTFFLPGMAVLPERIVSSFLETYNVQNAPSSGGCSGISFAADGSAGGGAIKKSPLAVRGVFSTVCSHGIPFFVMPMLSSENLCYHIVSGVLAASLAHTRERGFNVFGEDTCGPGEASPPVIASDLACIVPKTMRRLVDGNNGGRVDFFESLFSLLYPRQQRTVRVVNACDASSADFLLRPPIFSPGGGSVNQALRMAYSVSSEVSGPGALASSGLPSSSSYVQLPPVAGVLNLHTILPGLHSQLHNAQCQLSSGSGTIPYCGRVPEAAEWWNRELAEAASSVYCLGPATFASALESIISNTRAVFNNNPVPRLLADFVKAHQYLLGTAGNALHAFTAGEFSRFFKDGFLDLEAAN